MKINNCEQEIIKFASWLTNQNEDDIKQLFDDYNDYKDKNLPEIKGGRVGAEVMPNEVLAGGNKRWKPKEKEIFYYVNFYTGVTEQVYTNSKIHTPRNLYKIGNCYKTRGEAQIKWEQIKQILLQR